MKILIILEYYYPNIGGVEKLFKDLAESLVLNGHEVKVITTQFKKDLPLRENLNGVKIRRLKLTNRFTFTFFSIFSILPQVKKFDVIHTTSYNAAFPAWLAAKIFLKKTIITFHEVWSDLWKELPYINGFQRFLYASYEAFILKLKFDTYIAVSDFTKNRLIESGIPKAKIQRIYNGISSEEYQIAAIEKPAAFTFTYFGRLGISKGLDIILPAAREFIKKHPDSIFKCIIPQLPESFFKRILNDIEALNFEEKIQLMHHLPFSKLTKEIVASNCVLIPSYSEGFCFAAVETTALKVPIISSGKGALQETVSGKYILMDSFDEKGLVDALEKAYHNDYIDTLTKEFSLEKSIVRYLELYEQQ